MRKMNKMRERTTASLLITIFMTSIFAVTIFVSAANPTTIESSTMEFEGPLTQSGNGYIGIIPMIVDGEYDVYAKDGATAWFGSPGPSWSSATISGHDAWPGWDPDTPD
jgi:hypothetical protein